MPGLNRRPKGILTGNCPIREHAGDGVYVGRCDFACYDDVCPRHGRVSIYPKLDDRDVAVADRDFTPDSLAVSLALNQKVSTA